MNERRIRDRAKPLKVPFAHTHRTKGLQEVVCRVCGTIIGKIMPVGDSTIRRMKNHTIIETMAQFAYTASYREVDILMEDGGRHVGNACAECASKLSTDSGLLASFCETDLAQWRSEGITITERMDRRPVKVLRVEETIKD